MPDSLKKIVFQLASVFLLTFGIVGVVSLLTYNPYDPSWDFSTNAAIKNKAGVIGSNMSSLYLNFIGYTGYVISFVFIVWAALALKNSIEEQEVEEIEWYNRPSAKFLFLVLAALSMSATFSVIDEFSELPKNWSAVSHGGFLGMFLKNAISPLLGIYIYGIIMFGLAVASLFFAFGLEIETWKEVISKIYQHTSVAVLTAIAFCIGVYNYLVELIQSRMDEQQEEDAPTIKIKKKRTIIEKPTAKKVEKEQQSFDLEMHGDFQLPPIAIMTIPDDHKSKRPPESSLTANAELLEKVLSDFGVQGKIVEVEPGPVVTRYALEPAPGTKSSRVIGLADDISRSMMAQSARISVISGQNAIGVELPNANRETVYFKELLMSEEFKKAKEALPLILGKDISGNAIVIDLAKTPHLLVAGTTGSGKSVGLNGMILSLLYKFAPHECKFIMIDPKMLELSVYQDIPHLLTPVVTEPNKAIVALKWAVKEMENRYRLMSTLNVRNVDGYNQKIMEAVKQGKVLTRSLQTGYDVDTGRPTHEEVPLKMEKLPYIVVVVDEMADLMIVAGKEIEASVQRLAQMARAAGIHVILATQRPSVDVITGIIKANFPTRISFQVTSKIDSRTILGEMGAEQLLGRGDMLYMASGSKITRVHGAFITDDEVHEVAKYLRNQAPPSYVEDVTAVPADGEDGGSVFDAGGGGLGGSEDPLYDQAVQIVIRDQKVSTSYVQRALKIGYNKAANLIEKMEREGVISEADHVGRRQILMK